MEKSGVKSNKETNEDKSKDKEIKELKIPF